MSQIKIVSATCITVGNIKKGDLYSDLESSVNAAMAEGWEVVGSAPDREVLGNAGFIVTLLRRLPFINVIMNWIMPIKIESAIGVILKKD